MPKCLSIFAIVFAVVTIYSGSRPLVLQAPALHRKAMEMVFKPIPDEITIYVKMVPQVQQRYDTEGDWQWSGDTLEVRISREVQHEDPHFAVLLLTHELVEALLCRAKGVTSDQVDAFDMAFSGTGEPGDDPAAPYHSEHEAAEAAERALAGALNVNWRSYLGK